MNVENAYGNDDRQPHQYHGEEKIFAQQWKRKGCRRNDFWYQQEEHRLRQQNADAERNLLAGVGRQVKH